MTFINVTRKNKYDIPEIMCIYKFTNIINGKIYVGQTKNLRNRYFQHKSKNQSNIIFTNAIKKYGFENFQVEVLELVEDEQFLDTRETYYIDFYNSTVRAIGYNILRQNLKRQIGGLPPESERRRMESLKRAHENNPNLLKMRTEHFVENYVKSISRKINQVDAVTGEIVKTWDSMQQAADTLGIHRSSISRCARKVLVNKKGTGPSYLKIVGGFIWEFPENERIIKENIRNIITDSNNNFKSGNIKNQKMIFVEYKGQTKKLSIWCKELNLKYSSIANRIRKGWNARDAFELPIIRGRNQYSEKEYKEEKSSTTTYSYTAKSFWENYDKEHGTNKVEEIYGHLKPNQ